MPSYSERDQSLLTAIGGLYQEIRKELGLSGRQAAIQAGTDIGRISRLENGKTDVQILTLQKIAEAYGYEIEFNLIPIRYTEEVA